MNDVTPAMTGSTMREIYFVSLSFDMPMEGTVRVAAESLEHAKTVAADLFKNRNNLQIVDVYNAKDAPGVDTEEASADFMKQVN